MRPLRVLVTGSSRGIGRESALEFARRGARVVIHGRDASHVERCRELFRSEGLDAHSVVGDISDPRDAARIVEEAVAALGGLDVLVNNAGMAMRGRFDATVPEVWAKVVGTNTMGTAYVTSAALPHIRESVGSIVFVSSLVGLWGFPLLSAYSASKMALNGLVQCLRTELHGSGVHLGILYVGITENDEDKRILAADGSPLSLVPRSKTMRQRDVARAVCSMVHRRRASRVLTFGGWVTTVLTRAVPSLIPSMLARASKMVELKAR